LERQLASAQQLALQSTGDWKKYEQRVNELEAELHEYKLQFERERRDKAQAQHDYDTVRLKIVNNNTNFFRPRVNWNAMSRSSKRPARKSSNCSVQSTHSSRKIVI
jgi:hypothetical protein